MKGFLDHQSVISESLDSAKEFYMTEDTEIPKRIVGVFEIDGLQYGMALEESNFPRIYTLRMYRFVKKRIRLWTFHKPNHILPALSTLIKFVESSLPFLQGKFDGVIVPYAKKIAGGRVKKMAERMVKKTYVSSFRYVPVEGTGKDNIYDYVFLMKKQKNPSEVFKSKRFVGYEFDGEVSVDLAQNIQPKKVMTKVPTLEPSLKYQFKGLDLEATTKMDAEKMEKILNAKPLGKSDDKKEDKADVAIQKAKDKLENWKELTTEYVNMTGITTTLAANMPSMFNKLKQYGFDKSKINKGDLEYVVKQEAGKNLLFRLFLHKYGIMKEGQGKVDTDKIIAGMEALDDDIKSYGANTVTNWANMAANNIKSFNKEFDELNSEMENAAANKFQNAEANVVESDIDPHSLVTPYAEHGMGISYNPDGSIETSGSYSIHHVEVDILYEEGFNDKMAGLGKWNHSAIKKYTGSAYSSYNNALRASTDAVAEGNYEAFYNQSQHYKEIGRIIKSFEKIDPIKKPLWVYRGGYVPNKQADELEVGAFYSDAGIMSTSLRSNIGFGSNLKMAIYIPEGSRILPALGSQNSNHDNEREIILPPLAALKIIRYSVHNGVHNLTTVFVGTAVHEVMKQGKKKAELKEGTVLTFKELNSMLSEAKKKGKDMQDDDKKYDSNDKFNGGSFNSKLAKQVGKLIKKKGK